MPGRLSLRAARRAALAAQGFGRPRPTRVTLRHVQGEIARLAQFQIDSVNVAVRAHLMPLFARLGPYDTALLDRAWSRAPLRLFEYWGHAACLVDVDLQPALRWRMAELAERERRHVGRIAEARPTLLQQVLADVVAGGPLTARDIETVEARSREHWGWNWSEAKYVLEYLFDSGQLSVAGRNRAFERLYDLNERVLPARVLGEPTLSAEKAHDALVHRSARALGVADLAALAGYFYLRQAPARASVARLERSGELEPVEIRGLPGQYWRWHQAKLPRSLHANALVSPFDSLVFDRKRLEQLFGMRYRIEIYVPEAQRVHGYYVYVFVLGEVPAARIDLKADRAAGVLRVQAAWLEPGCEALTTARALAEELHAMAGWLSLRDVSVAGRGTLAGALASVV
ncbi:MAG: winged helix-turn-helix domain-containing protein [Actinomycetes bacterium]